MCPAIGADDNIELVKKDPEEMSVRKVCHLCYFDPANLEDCRKAIRIEALSPGWREGFEDRLEKAGIAIERREEPKDEMCCGPTGQEALED